ncbi:MAG: hypothetical protein AAF804_09345 [Bacteroidota bacterium]
MANTCLFFTFSQIPALSGFSLFDVGSHRPYFDESKAAERFDLGLTRSLRPWTAWVRGLTEEFGERFRVSLAMDGLMLERLAGVSDLLDELRGLTEQQSLTWVAMPYFHSLSFLYGRGEFMRQVQMHREKLQQLGLGHPTAFYHPGGIYGNPMAFLADKMGFSVLITEGAGRRWEGRSSQYLYHPANMSQPRLLMRASMASDAWHPHGRGAAGTLPNPREFAQNLIDAPGQLTTLQLNLGQLNFSLQADAWKAVCGDVLKHRGLAFVPLAELATWACEGGMFEAEDFVSAHAPHDLSPWQGSPLQTESLDKLYWLEGNIQAWQDQDLMRTWSLLQHSDYFLQMSHGDYLNYMNILADFQLKLGVEAFG